MDEPIRNVFSEHPSNKKEFGAWKWRGTPAA
jgi:hypothetical protein